MAELWSMKRSVFEQSSRTSTCKLSGAQGIEYWVVCGSGWLYPDTDKWSMFSTFICKKIYSNIYLFIFLTQLSSVLAPCRFLVAAGWPLWSEGGLGSGLDKQTSRLPQQFSRSSIRATRGLGWKMPRGIKSMCLLFQMPCLVPLLAAVSLQRSPWVCLCDCTYWPTCLLCTLLAGAII